MLDSSNCIHDLLASKSNSAEVNDTGGITEAVWSELFPFNSFSTRKTVEVDVCFVSLTAKSPFRRSFSTGRFAVSKLPCSFPLTLVLPAWFSLEFPSSPKLTHSVPFRWFVIEVSLGRGSCELPEDKGRAPLSLGEARLTIGTADRIALVDKEFEFEAKPSPFFL